MCGIVGYAGHRQALDVVLEGLSRLEYRGYDSAGIAVIAGGKIAWAKRAGKLGNLTSALAESPPLPGMVGLGHTRWATHGAPTDPNAHPHTDCGGHLAVVHNGIIENFADLRDELEARGHIMTSETDTELVAHLLEDELAGTWPGAGPADRQSAEPGPAGGWPSDGWPADAAGPPRPAAGSLAAGMRAVCQRLDGTFTLVAVDIRDPDVVVGARRNSPLVVGRGHGENFLASDVAAFISFTKEAIEIGQDQVAEIRADSVEVTNFDGSPAQVRDFVVDWDAAAAEKAGFKWFMTKEIAEQPRAIADALVGRVDRDGLLVLDEMRLSDEELRGVDKIVVLACGTSFHAGLIAKYAIEHWCKIPCEVELASEFRYSDPILTRSTLVIAISQSGETLDTLMAVRHAREQRSRVLAVCNVKGSSIPRESDAVVYTHAGPEMAVASTKAFLTQLISCYVVALYLAQVQGTMFADEIGAVLDDLRTMPAAVEEILELMEPVREVARQLAGERCVLFLGRHVGFPVALEGALKLKELAYMHAEGFAAGELKHGPIALIEPGLPVVVVVPPPSQLPVLHDKIVSNIQEIRARGARTIVIAERGDARVMPFADTLIELPVVPSLMQPLVATVPLQVFACELADAKGHDVDQPRNLAKSVTVE
ncbi:MAG TPA: glutamine--fructose-6-phosphate transaminase (isomerizing) [Streptosporangiaceae bacterium]|nr:glutamine--fructose-6-phosphate transaminase (isomerizing) [Streptosporangiaceae bacterium]